MVIDRAVVLQALKAMEANRYAVANQAPHGDVMAYNAAAEALRAAVLAQEQAEPVQRAMQDAVTTGMGIMRGGERIDPSTIYKPIEGVPV